MECWTWGDVAIYVICTVVCALWWLSPLGILIVLLKFPYFLFVELPINTLLNFKVYNFERRIPNRNFSTWFEYSAMLFVRWVLRTFHSDIIRKLFFSDTHARVLFNFRRFKYGTENIGDFDYRPVSGSNADLKAPNGYWVYSRSRRNRRPDLVIYFVPGGILGCCSPYIYLEYLSMMLVELQVQGFRNPIAFCLDIDAESHRSQTYGFASIIKETADGWDYVQREYPHAKTLFMGSGIGATVLLSLLLQIARPFISAPPFIEEKLSSLTQSARSANNSYDGTDDSELLEPSTIATEVTIENSNISMSKDYESDTSHIECPSGLKKPDGLLLISPFPRATMKGQDSCADFLTSKALDKSFRRLVTDEEIDCLWTMPGCVRDSQWWSEAIPHKGAVIMHGELELLEREESQLIQTLQDMEEPRTISSCQPNEIHSWPITRSFLARTATDQLDGITQVADHVSKMLVMDCLFANSSFNE